MSGQECPTTKNLEQRVSPPAKKSHFRCHIDPFFLLNFAWIIVLGAGVLYWIGSFTGHLETAVGLLGLGGIFAWVAFFLNLVQEERKKELQLMLDSLLKLKTISLILVFCTGMLVMIAWNLGCIITDSSRDTLDRSIEIRPEDNNKTSYSTNLWPRVKAKFPVCTGFRGRDYEIDVEGLPLMLRTVRPFSRVRVKVPGDFLRCNVVLVHPSIQLTGSSSKVVGKDGLAKHMFAVRLDGVDMGDIPFHGQTVWIGSGKALHIPTSVKDRWRIEIAANENAPASTLLHWFEPSFYKKISKLKAKQKLEIFVKTADGKVFASASDTVKQCDSEDKFPQILPIKIK